MAASRQVPKRMSGFVKGLLTGSVLAAAACGAVAYKFLEDDFRRRHKIKRGFEILKHGIPERPPPLIYYTNHVVSYDSSKKIPSFVIEHLTKNSIQGEANRRRSKFQQDPSLPLQFSSSTDDYWNSGWSRGHLIPAGDNKFSQEAMDETFFLTNIIPQDVENNTGFWNRLEIYCRELAEKYSDIRIVSGTLYRPFEASDKKRYVKYEVIGKNNVAVPTHLYKIIVAERKGTDTKHMAAFVVPNAPLGFERDLKKFQVSLEIIEKEAGVQFFKKLNRRYCKDLCEQNECQLMSQQDFQRYYLTRKLENSRTLNRLEKVWNEIEMHGLKQDKKLSSLYEQKRQVLHSSGSTTQVATAA